MIQKVLRGTVAFLVMISILGTFGVILLLESKTHIYSYASHKVEEANTPAPFPVSVNIHTKTITDSLVPNTFFTSTLATRPQTEDSWWNKIAILFADKTWYQNLASPVSRIVVIRPGQRKEEIVKHIGDIIGWSKTDRENFMELIDTTDPALAEGKYFPNQYVTHKDATPQDISALINTSFQSEILARYTPDVAAQVPLKTALTIASLLEREASDFANMREISGVIWNRLFSDMPLQLDATLQYVKGSNPYEPTWWPAVHPNDKFADSAYNTYQNEGLPPTPIASPSTEAILAALNPIQTDCLFYFHTGNATYHCSATYQEHVSKLRSIYGRGS